MFDVGLSELLVIGLVALIVLGPKRLPEMARAAGRWTARIRRFVSEVKSDFDRELHNAELTELHKLKQELDETRHVMEDSSSKLMQDLQTVEARTAAAAAANTIAPPAPETPSTARKKKSRRKKTAAKSRHGRTKRIQRARRG
ncbi:MAG: twin-arginine translocase subunit TatB [Gammaproteobacteria bacterium]|nr:MAG: twin-arginine translocase subunit TatB [Gammaproteobacteria bacterium]